MRGALRSGRRGPSSLSRSVDKSRPAWLRVQKVVWENSATEWSETCLTAYGCCSNAASVWPLTEPSSVACALAAVWLAYGLKRGVANRFRYDHAHNNHNWEASTMARQPIGGTPSTRVGPFSPAVSGSNLIFVSGQVAVDPTSGALIDGDISTETEQVLRNLAAVLEAAGKNLGDVLRVGVYLTDMQAYSAMNEVYVKHFEAPYPARTAIAVAALPLGAAVEMDAIVG